MIAAPPAIPPSAPPGANPARPVSGQSTTELLATLAHSTRLVAEEAARRMVKAIAPTPEAVEKIVKQWLEVMVPRKLEAVDPSSGIKLGEISEHTRPEFEMIASTIAAGVNTLVVGPAGCGKTHLAHQIATVLGLDFAFLSLTAGISEARLVGRFVPIGEHGRFEYVPAPFVTLYENGGLFLADEIDAADPNVMLSINSALANGHMETPNPAKPIIQRHPKFRMMAAANTWGHGANRQYVGRNQLDAATLDRFAVGKFELDYDTDYEHKAGKPELVAWVHELREKIATHNIRRVASTRLVLDGSKRLLAGHTLADVKASYFMDWSDSERRLVN